VNTLSTSFSSELVLGVLIGLMLTIRSVSGLKQKFKVNMPTLKPDNKIKVTNIAF
jgi:hypothetical protein